MCISALIETGGDRDEVRKALERGEVWLMDNLPKVRRGSADALYNIWSHIYGIQAFVRMHERATDVERKKKIAKLIDEQIGFLIRYESIDKGWGYYDFRIGSQRPATDSTSFMTAAALVALREAKDIGIDVPDKLIKGAVDSIHRQRKPDFAYLYGEYLKYTPQHPINLPGGSLADRRRATWRYACGRTKPSPTRSWRPGSIACSRARLARHGPQEADSARVAFRGAGYFFYFGHYYAGLASKQLPKKSRRIT